MARISSHYQPRRADGKRSGLEAQVSTHLDSLDIGYQYEKGWIEYEVSETRKYLPDFRIATYSNKQIIIETKGRFETKDRKKHLLIKAQHPELDIRFVFSNPNTKISKQSTTTYAMWCEKHGFLYAKGFVPKEWLP